MAEQESPRKEAAQKAYEKLKLLGQGLTAREATRTASRMSKWANPTYMQYKDINKAVTKDMVKTIWPCADTEIKKGRWKVSKCLNEDIRNNAERIFLEVFGHPLHNADCPLYFAKMLYVQFVQHQNVDFASKEKIVATHDLREETVTFTREEMALMVDGAGLELTKVKESLEAKFAEKEQEAVRLSQVQTPPPPSNRRVEEQLKKLSQDVQGISNRMQPLRQGNHIQHFLMHPEVIPELSIVESTSSDMCPICYKVFDGWSGHYTLACGHYCHMVCLVRQMQNEAMCPICGVAFPQGLYTMFGMGSDYKAPIAETPSVLRNLFTDES